jgi:hypothetical protein
VEIKSMGIAGLLNQKKGEKLTLYGIWKQIKKNTDGYLLIANEIEDYLKDLKKPSLNLYMFYAIHADNDNGDSYYSLDKIAKILNVSVKTISNWNRELEEVGLIKRKQQYNNSAITFLLPLSDFIFLDKQSKIDDFVLDISNEGYKYEDKYELRNSKEAYSVEKYKKTYISITRTIYVLQKNTTLNDNILWDYDEDCWYDLDNSLGVYSKDLNFDLGNKISYKKMFETLSILFNDSNSINNIKENIRKKE